MAAPPADPGKQGASLGSVSQQPMSRDCLGSLGAA